MIRARILFAVIDAYRLACRVARAYAARVEGGVSVHQVDAGSEPVGLLDCFIGQLIMSWSLLKRLFRYLERCHCLQGVLYNGRLLH